MKWRHGVVVGAVCFTSMAWVPVDPSSSATVELVPSGVPSGVAAEVYVGPIPEGLAVTGLHCEECFDEGLLHGFADVACGATFGSVAAPLGSEAPQFTKTAVTLLGSWCYDCHRFNSCHEDMQDGLCSTSHSDCHAETLRLTKDLEAAIDAGNLTAVTNMLTVADQFVRLNTARNAVQVVDCNSRVLGHYVIEPMWVTALE